MNDNKRRIVEHVGGDFGVTVIYTLDSQYDHHVEFFAAEIVARSSPENEPLYEAKGAQSSLEHVTDPLQAERLFAGSVKWDGCSHVDVGDSNGYIHLCGREAFDKLTATLIAVYERCGELMKERGVNLLEGEFTAAPSETES